LGLGLLFFSWKPGSIRWKLKRFTLRLDITIYGKSWPLWLTARDSKFGYRSWMSLAVPGMHFSFIRRFFLLFKWLCFVVNACRVPHLLKIACWCLLFNVTVFLILTGSFHCIWRAFFTSTDSGVIVSVGQYSVRFWIGGKKSQVSIMECAPQTGCVLNSSVTHTISSAYTLTYATFSLV